MKSKQILNEIAEIIKEGNGRAEDTILKYKNYLTQYPEFENELTNGIYILNEIVRLRNKLNKTNLSPFKKKLFLACFSFTLILSLFIITASINYKINGVTKFSVGENETLVANVLRGIDQVLLEESISFRTLIGNEEIFSLYRADSSKDFSNVSSDFDGVFIHQMSKVTNLYGMEELWWDKEDQIIHFAINHEPFTNRSNTFRGSLQIVSNNKTIKPNDLNFTLCEGNNYVDCIGGDIFTFGDIEAQNIYANYDIYANGSIDSEDGIGVPIINAINISTDNLNADLVQAPLGKFTNITGDKLNIDIIYSTDIIVTNLEVSDLTTGGNEGTSLCVDSNDVLCICGSCA